LKRFLFQKRIIDERITRIQVHGINHESLFLRSNNIPGKNIEFDEKNGTLRDLTSGITQDTVMLKRKIEMDIAGKGVANIVGQLEIIKGG